MRRMQWIARWLIVCSVVNGLGVGVAQAQPACEKPVWITAEQWSNTQEAQRQEICLAERVKDRKLNRTPSVLDSAPEPQIRSGSLALIGIAAAVIGVIIAVPQGETYTVLGDGYCVKTNSVDAGACSTTTRAKKIGGAMILGGLALTFIGMQKVTVSPVVSKQTKGAAVTVRW